ncbi:MAG: type II secretion system protein [Acidobacteriota bacterium]
MRSTRGFSLLELLIVVGIIGILSVIAVPSLLAARRSANEASAIATLKTFLQANHTYFAVHRTFGTPGQLYAAKFVDEVLGEPTPIDCGKVVFNKHGYTFTMVPTKLERKINRTSGTNAPAPPPGGPPSGGGGQGGGSKGPDIAPGGEQGGNDKGDEIRILEFYMDGIPITAYRPSVSRTGIRWFYIDSLSNIPWVIKASLDGMNGNPCSNSSKYVCYDLTNGKPKYDNCIPLN